MTWPSPQPPLTTNQTTATVQPDTHPADHANENQAINDDIAPQLEQNRVNISTYSCYDDHRDLHETHALLDLGNVIIEQPGSTVPQISIALDGLWQIRHGMFQGWANSNTNTITNTGTQLGTFVELPVTGSAGFLRDNMPIGYGAFRADTADPFVPVIGFWDADKGTMQLQAQKDEMDNTFAAIGPGMIFRFTWCYPTNRADTIPV